MILTTKLGDRFAVGASLLCGIHCFIAPIVLAMLPSLQALSFLEDERFHLWMLFGVLPTSMLTLAMGCRKHKRPVFLAIGLLGMSILTFSAIWGHDLLGCKYEKYLTLLGSLIIMIAHFNNYLLCRRGSCSENNSCDHG